MTKTLEVLRSTLKLNKDDSTRGPHSLKTPDQTHASYLNGGMNVTFITKQSGLLHS
jgi:hypothetical protein